MGLAQPGCGEAFAVPSHPTLCWCGSGCCLRYGRGQWAHPHYVPDVGGRLRGWAASGTTPWGSGGGGGGGVGDVHAEVPNGVLGRVSGRQSYPPPPTSCWVMTGHQQSVVRRVGTGYSNTGLE